jgi:hypothetical protein
MQLSLRHRQGKVIFSIDYFWKVRNCQKTYGDHLMVNIHHRMVRERKTMEAMVRLYCTKKHGKGKKMCVDCSMLFEYAMSRLSKCPYQENKPTCAKCTIHCYKEPERSKIKMIMRFSGPRMLGRHPILAIRHIIDRSKGPKKMSNKIDKDL